MNALALVIPTMADAQAAQDYMREHYDQSIGKDHPGLRRLAGKRGAGGGRECTPAVLDTHLTLPSF